MPLERLARETGRTQVLDTGMMGGFGFGVTPTGQRGFYFRGRFIPINGNSSSPPSGSSGGATTPPPSSSTSSTFNPLTGSWTGNPPAPQRPPLVLPQYPGVGDNYSAWLASLQAIPVGPMAPTNGSMFDQVMGGGGLPSNAIPERPTIPPNTPPSGGPISEVISKPSTPTGPGFPDGRRNWNWSSRFRTRRANRPYGA